MTSPQTREIYSVRGVDWFALSFLHQSFSRIIIEVGLERGQPEGSAFLDQTASPASTSIPNVHNGKPRGMGRMVRSNLTQEVFNWNVLDIRVGYIILTVCQETKI